VTAPIEEIREVIARARRSGERAILGMHIEGPFLSPARRGAQNPAHIIEPSLGKLDELVRGHENFIRIVTLAPELRGAHELIGRILEIGAIASIGHSDATYEEALHALSAGAALFTHVFNAMRGFHHREPGAVGAALISDAMVELICDGIHVHPGAVQLLVRAKGIDNVCLITDSISAAGLHDGYYSLAGLQVSVQAETATLADGTLAGSTVTMEKAVQNLVRFTRVSLPQAVRTASLNPARLVGLDKHKGSLEVGKDADITMFNRDYEVYYTISGGEVVYARKDEADHRR
jgi:N-acetylglucosamine-6-phosphate deacetylase